ncbi:MAG: lipoyl synthase [Candidatus Omnitrophota bacterium]|jgi:lipoic acid synthetase|nr:MAG: lipoyl synthase [Candidatus Omnitrophota bacterium]
MSTVLKKPTWLHKKIELSGCQRLEAFIREARLNTVCQQAHCPNRGECFSKGEATFLILGNTCTRKCSFCRVEKDRFPQAPDREEPYRLAWTIRQLGLAHVVITSVTRDDLADGGAGHFAASVSSIRSYCPEISIELLIPDFLFNTQAIKTVVEARPDIIAHNIETVPGLYASVRPGAEYNRSVEVLRYVKELDAQMYTKSGLMLGLGECKEEVLRAFADLRKAGCDFLSIGQYLAPSLAHYPVREYVVPDMFEYYRTEAESLGFLHVESAPYVRSSYRAAEYLRKVEAKA